MTEAHRQACEVAGRTRMTPAERRRRLRQGKPIHTSYLKWCEARLHLPHDIEVYREEQKEKQKAWDRRYYRNHKGEHKAHAMKVRYGLSIAEYSARVIAQDGRCAICGQLTHVLSVDHDHITGRVRGLLCPLCNICIGQMGESPERLRKAAEYLEHE